MAYKRNSLEEAAERTPYQFAFFLFLSLVLAWTAIRVGLILQLVPPPHVTPELGNLLLAGLQQDVLVALVLVLPVLGWFLIVPQRWYIERWQRFFFWTLATIVTLALVLALAAECWFFIEFQKRFDATTVQLALTPKQAELLFPKPAIWWWLAACVMLTLLFVTLAKRSYASMWLATSSPLKRIGWPLVTVGLIAGLVYGSPYIPVKSPEKRLLREISGNGLRSLAEVLRHPGTTNYGAQFTFAPADLPPDPPLGVSGEVRRHESVPSKLVEARPVHVWLPPGYAEATDRRYPVIYAQDGQNQFDPATSVSGTDWATDETLSQLIAAGQARAAIVVAVWHGAKRLPEYVPQKAVVSALKTWREPAMRRMAEEFELRVEDRSWRLSEEYLRFLVQELKPFIDSEYRTLANRDNTFIMGASAGGMISLYAVSEHPEVFGGAACLSVHWPTGDGVLVEYFRHKLPHPATHRIYFDYGTEGRDRDYAPYQLKMDAAMEARGYQAGTNWLTGRFQGAEHSEKSWRRRVQVPLTFLLGKPAVDQDLNLP